MINLSVRSDFGIQVQNRQTSNIASEITGKRKNRVKCSVNHFVTIFVLQTQNIVCVHFPESKSRKEITRNTTTVHRSLRNNVQIAVSTIQLFVSSSIDSLGLGWCACELAQICVRYVACYTQRPRNGDKGIASFLPTYNKCNAFN